MLKKAFLAIALSVCPWLCQAGSPQALYAGTNGVVFLSTDGGLTWATIGSGLGNVESLAADPANPAVLYAGSGAGIFKTIDGGAHWTLMNNGLNTAGISSVDSIVIDPTNTSTVYAATGTFGHGIFKTTDGGATWTAINSGLVTNGNLDVHAIVIDPTNTQNLYATGNTGFESAKTTNGGTSWTPMANSIAFGLAAAINPAQPTTVYFAGPFGEICRTMDGGATWSCKSGLITTIFGSIAVDPNNPTTLYAGSVGCSGFNPCVYSHAIVKTIDGGNTWTNPGAGIATSQNVRALIVDSSNSSNVYAGADAGVFASTDGGVTWNLVLPSSAITSFAMGPLTPQAALLTLLNTVQGLASPGGPLNSGQANALLVKLQDALNDITGGNAKVTCNHLTAFVNQVASLVQGGVLTPAQGANLTAQAQAIMQLVPCQ